MLDMIGPRLKQLRGDLSQEAFARIAGTTKLYVSQLESGKNLAPNAVYIGKWAAHFGVSMEWLTFGRDAPNRAVTSQPARLDPVTLTTALETVIETARRMDVPLDPLARGTAVASLYTELSGIAPDPAAAVSMAITAIVSASKKEGV